MRTRLLFAIPLTFILGWLSLLHAIGRSVVGGEVLTPCRLSTGGAFRSDVHLRHGWFVACLE